MADTRADQMLEGFITGTPISAPVTRLEFFLAALSDESVTPPTPQTRTEALLMRAVEHIRSITPTPSPSPVLTTLEATENRTYTPPPGVDGFSSAVVDVPTYGAPDAGKVVHVEGGTASLVQQGTATVGVNGPVDTTEVRELTVAVNPYLYPFTSPLTLTAAGPIRVLTVLLYTQSLSGWQVSAAVLTYDGAAWTKENEDGLGTFSIATDAEHPETASITVTPPSTGTLVMRGYAYI